MKLTLQNFINVINEHKNLLLNLDKTVYCIVKVFISSLLPNMEAFFFFNLLESITKQCKFFVSLEIVF